MNLFLAPMDGITDLAYRIIVKEIFERHNKKDNLYMVTEFMSSDGFIANPKGVLAHMLKTEYDTPLIAQFFGGDKENLVRTAKSLDTDYDFMGIELNIGCPSPRIIACGAGSGMMKDKNKTLEVIKALKDNTNGHLSIKTRCGILDIDKPKQMEFIIKASQICDMITIHGRTFNKGHSGDVDWNFIYEAKKKVNPKCKIIGNGGIHKYTDALEKYQDLDGIMIGQRAIGNPWIFTEIIPSKEELKDTIIRHLELLTATEIYMNKSPFDENDKLIMPKLSMLDQIISGLNEENTRGLKSAIEFRKHLFSYVKGIPGSKEFKQNIIMIRDFHNLKIEIEKFFKGINFITERMF